MVHLVGVCNLLQARMVVAEVCAAKAGCSDCLACYMEQEELLQLHDSQMEKTTDSELGMLELETAASSDAEVRSFSFYSVGTPGSYARYPSVPRGTRRPDFCERVRHFGTF